MCEGLYHHKLGFERNLAYYAPFPIMHKFTVETLEHAFNLQRNFTYKTFLTGFNGSIYEYEFDQFKWVHVLLEVLLHF